MNEPTLPSLNFPGADAPGVTDPAVVHEPFVRSLDALGLWRAALEERIRDEAWERHKSAIGPHEKNREKVTTGGQHGGGSESVTETEDLNGDARFLKIALDAEAQMTRIIGAEKPIKHALTDADGNAIPFAVVRFAEMPSRPLPEVTDGGDSAPSGD